MVLTDPRCFAAARTVACSRAGSGQGGWMRGEMKEKWMRIGVFIPGAWDLGAHSQAIVQETYAFIASSCL